MSSLSVMVQLPDSPPDNLPQRIPELDGIRGVAILLVLLWHYAGSIIDPNINLWGKMVAAATATTWSGVDLFFVLSGFLIGGILLDNRDAPHYFKAFYVRRISRIFPLYYLWLFLFIGLTLVLPQFAFADPISKLFIDPMPLWTYLAYLQNFAMVMSNGSGPHWLGITWSLAVEEQFYALLPFLVRFNSLRRLALILIVFILLAPAMRAIAAAASSNSMAPYVLLPSRADALLLGVACAFVIRQKSLKAFLTRHTGFLYIALGSLFAIVVFLTIASPSLQSFAMVIWGYSVFAFFYACVLLLAVTEKRGIVTKIGRFRPLRELGTWAYGIYLCHQAVLWLTHGLILHQTPQMQTVLDLVVTLIALAVTLFIAFASWNLFESKFIVLGHRIQYHNQSQDLVRAEK